MERVEQYRKSIRQVLTSHATFESGNSNIESQLVFDTEHDHYQLLEVGWEDLSEFITVSFIWTLRMERFGFSAI